MRNYLPEQRIILIEKRGRLRPFPTLGCSLWAPTAAAFVVLMQIVLRFRSHAMIKDRKQLKLELNI